jgi:5-methylcytosine-specific restriction endonuclease McrA
MRRNTTTRDKHRAQIARTQPPCGICGQPIDYTLPHLDPGAYVVDHIIALVTGGPDTLQNKQAAHRSCNAAKAGKQYAPILKRSGSLRPVGEAPPGGRAPHLPA